MTTRANDLILEKGTPAHVSYFCLNCAYDWSQPGYWFVFTCPDCGSDDTKEGENSANIY